MSFAIVTVLHESAADLRRLLDSLELLPERPQLVCVDTGSGDDGAHVAAAWGADVVRLDGNPGFGAANNAGLARVERDVTVLLNPDCVLRDDGLARLAALAAGREALLAPRLLNADGSLQRSAHDVPGTRLAYLAAVVPPRVLPRAMRERLEPFRAAAPLGVGWAIGACLAAPTELLRRLGPFDPRQFLYAEDLDLCLRAGAAGIPTEQQPQIAIVHRGGHATATEPFELKARRRREVIAANLGPAALRRDDRAQALTFALRAGAGRDRARNRAQLDALRAARGA